MRDRPKRPPFAPTAEIRNRLKDLFSGLLEKYPGWTFRVIKGLTLRQVVDILLRDRGRGTSRAVDPSAPGPAKEIHESEGPLSLEKDLMDLELMRCLIGEKLGNYEEAKAKIKAKWAAKNGRPDDTRPDSPHGTVD